MSATFMERNDLVHDFENINLRPSVSSTKYVFVSLQDPTFDMMQASLSIFKEAEGVSLIISQKQADQWHMNYDGVYSLITIGIYTALDASGLTAKISTALALAKIPCNMMAAFHHDHLLVSDHLAEKAMDIIERLS